MLLSVFAASTAFASRAALHVSLPVVQRSTTSTMLDLDNVPVLGIGLLGVGTLGLLVASGAFNDDDAAENAARVADLQDRIQTARTTAAQTYREIERSEEALPEEARARRERVRARAQEMLDGARQAVQEGLDEALATEDYDAAEEFVQMLEKLRPLPTGIVPTSEEADYKRWIDPKSLKG